jgi:hypothetical protein
VTAAMRGKYSSRICHLDPVRDCREIVFLLTCFEFPWDIERSLEFALFRTYAVPSISGLLDKTGEFSRRPRKRYDDTELLLAEILENGFDSQRGRAALSRVNQMHGRFPIENSDFLYVLSTFVFEPIRWIDRFGWRALTPHEKHAIFHYYRELGRRMHIREIPDRIAELERFNRDYEAQHFRYVETNRRVGSVTRDLLLSFYLPRPLIPIGRPAAHAMMDEPLLQAMGFPRPPAFLRRALTAALKLRKLVLKRLPDRQSPHLLTEVARPTYPEGYRVEELGTFRKHPMKTENHHGAD